MMMTPHSEALFARRFAADGPFSTRAELIDYFARDKLTCLICGSLYIALAPHVLQTHGVTAADYKIQFGIPQRYGLSGAASRKRARARMLELQRTGKVPRRPSDETIRKITTQTRGPSVVSAIVRAENVRKLLDIHGQSEPWQAAHFEEFLRRLESGRPVRDVAADPDMPSRKSFLRYLNAHPAQKRRFNELWDKLPFDVQVRANKTGETFRARIRQLRNAGLPWQDISRQMNVNASTLRNAWRAMKARDATDILQP